MNVNEPDCIMDMANLIDHAHWRLMDSDDPATQAAREYLAVRLGIVQGEWVQRRIGFLPNLKDTKTGESKPAIIFPRGYGNFLTTFIFVGE